MDLNYCRKIPPVTTVRVLVHVIGAWQVLLSATLHYNPNFQVLSKNHHAYFYYKLVKYDLIWHGNKLAVLDYPI